MKKILITLCSALLLLTSCEKTLSGELDDDTLSGNLTVQVAEVAQTPFAAVTRAVLPAAEACTHLNFAIYDIDGTRLKQVNQTSDKSNYGQASFQLEAGDYTLVVVGHNCKTNPTMTNLSKIQFTNGTGYTDTFLYCSDILVDDEPEERSICLDRIVSLCRFVLTDNYPAGVTKMQFYYTGGSGAFNAATGLGSVNSKQTVTFDVTDGQKQFDLYTFLHDAQGTVTLKVTALDPADNIVNERTFDVPMYVNEITWLQGAFFSGTGSSTTTPVSGVTVNTDWNGEHFVNF